LNSLTKVLLFSLLLLLAGASTVTQIIPTTEEQKPTELKIVVNDAVKEDTSVVQYVPIGKMKVSWYGEHFHGRQTANGETYDMESLTAAHRSLKFGTLLRLTNPESERSVVVRINDRGPYIRSRQLDVSKAAARELDILKKGVAKLQVEQITLQGVNFPIIPFN
jgi:rare lipoprotein A